MRQLNPFATKRENCVIATSRLLRLLSVSITESSLTKDLQEHPDYPSLLSMSNVLTSYGVENISIKSNIGKLDKLPLPLMAQLRSIQSGPTVFTVIKHITKHNIECLAPENDKWISLPKDEFAKWRTSVVLLAEVSAGAGPPIAFHVPKRIGRWRNYCTIILHNNPDVQVQIIFTAVNGEKNIKAPPAKLPLAIAEKGNEGKAKQALNDWYLADRKDHSAFAAKYPMNGELKLQTSK